MIIVEVSLLPLFRGWYDGWGGPILILEENLAFQKITKHHIIFQPSRSKRL